MNIVYDSMVKMFLWLKWKVLWNSCLENSMLEVIVSVSRMKFVLISWNSSFLSVSSGGSKFS